MILLNQISSLLRLKYIPLKFSYKIWNYISKLNPGKSFFFSTRTNNKITYYGGVCGCSDNALFFDVEKYEEELLPVYSDILKKTEFPVVLDVGANNGQSLMVIKSLNLKTEIHCFEPFPELAFFLNKLVTLNEFDNTYIINSILGEDSGESTIYFTGKSTETASTVADFQPSFNKSITVNKSSLDDYVKKHNLSQISLIKIDVEGGELEVIKGAQKLLENIKPDLILELLYTPDNLGNKHYERQTETISILHQLGYKFYQVRKDGKLHYQSIVKPDPDYKFLNYLVSAQTLNEETSE